MPEEPPPDDVDAPSQFFEPDTSPGGCATGECLPDAPEGKPAPASNGISLAASFAGRMQGGSSPAAAAPRSVDAPSASSDGSDASGHALWRQIVDAVRSASPRHGKSLAFGRLVRVSPGEVVIAFTSESDFHRATVSGSGKAIIEQVMQQITGRPTRLVIDPNAARDAPPSIAEEEARERAAHERSVDFRIRHHPALQAALRILGGELEHVLVLERERPTVESEPVDDST